MKVDIRVINNIDFESKYIVAYWYEYLKEAHNIGFFNNPKQHAFIDNAVGMWRVKPTDK